MFRKMRRFKQQLTQPQCAALLKTLPRGVLSVLGEDGYPYGLPINFIYDEAENKIYFHCARQGHKIDALKACNKASLCVYDEGCRKPGEWSLNIQSVIVFGRVSFVEDAEKTLQQVRALGLKYYPDAESVEVEIKQAIARVQLLEMSIDQMTGKLVNES